MNKKYIKLLITFIIFLSVTGAMSQDFNQPVIENEVEDANITGADTQGAAPNVVTILDLSGSMGRNFGNQQVGSWDQDSAIDFCEIEQCGGECTSSDSDNRRRNASQCAEVIANTNRCGSVCREGRCELPEEIIAFDACVQDLIASGELTDSDAPSGSLNDFFVNIYNNYCNGPTVFDCDEGDDSNQDRVNAVQDISNTLGLALCGSQSCNITCNSQTEWNAFETCMEDNTEEITVNRIENCVGGDPNCNGAPGNGSSRLDVALSVFLDVLDADNSLINDALCNDTSGQFDGTSPISCQDYLFTPFRFVENIILGSNLPAPTNDTLINQITDNDANELGVRFLPMSYSGRGNNAGCTGQNTFQLDPGGFQGGTGADLQRVWEFYRNQRAQGGTPLASILGFDDRLPGQGGNVINNDVLTAFNSDMPTDPALDCRPQFTIVITDGDDSCSGDCAEDNASCQGVSAASNNSNRRSSIKAVNNLRTFFSRVNSNNGVNNSALGKNVKKEVLTFVIGLGIDNEQARRALNAMALAGGTHTTGIIRHSDPATGAEFGEVNIEDVIPGDSNDNYEVLRKLARADGLDTNPISALLGTCNNPDLSGPNARCTLGTDNVFTNDYFNSGTLPTGEPVDLDGFAFFANNADELVAAINDILINIQEFTTSGVAPTAPQSSINVSARDRMFLSILTPRESERLWQGRLALYGFVSSQLPDNPGARTIIREPNGQDLSNPATVADLSIFSTSGNLDDDAKEFYWDAAKNLAERDLDANPRKLLTTDLLTTSTQNPRVIISDIKDFSTSTITPEELGIEDDDVFAETVYPPETCDDSTDYVDCTDDCTDVTSGAIDIMDVDAVDCRTCIKGCLRDQVVNFISGDTRIRPVFDPMGQPTTTNSASDSIGKNCPDVDDSAPLSSEFDTCSLRLGDVFHSTPVLVASPSPLFFDAGFQEFAKGFLERSAALYAGANDGFLHAFHAGEFVDASEASPQQNPFTQEDETIPFFDEGTGIEVFGFAPPTYLFDTLSVNSPDQPFGFNPDFRLGDFKSFVLENNSHRSFFDGSPTISDIWIDAYQNGLGDDTAICPQGDGVSISSPDGNIDLCGREWHTVLASGMRNGGGAITALNVTNFSCDAERENRNTAPDEVCLDSDLKHVNSGNAFPEHLWTTYDEDFGNTWSQPFVGRVQLQVGAGENITTTDRFVYFVGGGLDPTDTDPRDGVNKGNGFYVLDAPTGNVLFKFHPDNPSDNTLENIDDMQCDMAANIIGVDINVDGFTDLVYAGDTCGRMWRFDVSMPLETTGSLSNTGRNGSAVIEAPNWTGGVAFCTGTCIDGDDNVVIPPSTEDLQSVYFAPTVAFDRIGRRHVIFVTGNRRNPSKIADFDVNENPIAGTNEFGRLFNFIDNYIPAFLAGGTAVEAPIRTETEFITNEQVVKLTNAPAGLGLFEASTTGGFNDGLGEFIVEFPDNTPTPGGEKGFGRPLVLGRVLVFTTFAPDSTNTNPCIASFGDGRLFAIDYLTGESALNRIPGAQQSILDGVSSPEDIAGAKVAEGLPTTANLAFGTQGSAVLTVAFSGSPGSGGAQFLIWETPQKPAVTQTVFWEEIL